MTPYTLLNHRSIRKFTDQTINEEDLQSILQGGQAAATSSFVQTTSIVRVSDEDKLQALVELSGGQSYIASCATFLVVCADLHRLGEACRLHGMEPQGGFTEQFIVATVDASLFAQNMVVAAEAMGLGICYIGGLRNDPQQVSDLLALPEQVYPVFGLCLGYPDQDPEVKPRLPLPMVLMENTYDATLDTTTLAQYDEAIKTYYATRTGGTKEMDWSSQSAGWYAKEARPHMLAYLQAQGFLKR